MHLVRYLNHILNRAVLIPFNHEIVVTCSGLKPHPHQSFNHFTRGSTFTANEDFQVASQYEATSSLIEIRNPPYLSLLEAASAPS